MLLTEQVFVLEEAYSQQQLSQSLDNQMKVDIAKAKARDASEKEIFEIEKQLIKTSFEEAVWSYKKHKSNREKNGKHSKDVFASSKKREVGCD